MHKRIDLTGQRFGELTVLSLSNETLNDGARLWSCKCSCGKLIHAPSFGLLHGHYKSCGCKRDSKRDAGLAAYIKSDSIDGTRKSALQSKLHAGNKSGYKGVTWISSRKKWRAYIGFQGRQISLGYFDNIDDAIAARKAGEEKYHNPYK